MAVMSRMRCQATLLLKSQEEEQGASRGRPARCVASWRNVMRRAEGCGKACQFGFSCLSAPRWQARAAYWEGALYAKLWHKLGDFIVKVQLASVSHVHHGEHGKYLANGPCWQVVARCAG